jgi:hypothetical protein
MDIQSLLDGLTDRKALIVHFSHLANMRAGGVFPADLQAAIANKDCWALSCCVIWPGHKMDLPGEVGLILPPTANDQILSVAKTDAGSFQHACGADLSAGVPLTSETLEDTFDVAPKDYNEWRVRGAEIGGIFVLSPDGVAAKIRQPLMLDGVQIGDDIAPTRFTIEDVRTAFPGLRLITMTEHGPMTLS